MRVLLLLRGSPGCGKTTWIRENNLTNYTISSDDLRMMYIGTSYDKEGNISIDQTADGTVWKKLFEILEFRMQNGAFTVVDATNSKTSDMKRYLKLCDRYRYRIYCVDFTSIPIETVKERNALREEYKRVPESVIENMYSRFDTQKIPAGIKVITPDNLEEVYHRELDFSGFKTIHHIGDVHGCYTALSSYFESNGGLKDDELYIFCGDYIDRGIENAETMRFLLSIYSKPNVIMLEGNHERWLWNWANDEVCRSKEFELYTRPQLEDGGIDKKDVRQFYRKLWQCARYRYGANHYLVTHGGLSRYPEELVKVNTSEMIKGSGTYRDSEIVDGSFYKNSPDGFFQIHGHRNIKRLPTKINDKVFNLEGQVEFGGNLRCLQVLDDGSHNIVEIKNTVFKDEEATAGRTGDEHDPENNVGDLIISMRNNKYISEKRFGDVSSFNFTKSAFYESAWNEQTVKARGLYINIPEQRVVARAYNKFFNINERPETKLDALKNTMSFPAAAYVKENGFLGIVSYDKANNNFFITTKSNPEGDYSMWLRKMFLESFSAEQLGEIREYLKNHNVSFVFECVDMEHDPHIIEYPESELCLLDIVYNDINYKKYTFDEMKNVAEEIGMLYKELAFEFATWQEFYDFYETVTSDGYKYNGRNIEGFVVEDYNGNMVKVKLAYYHFWKFMRSVSHEVLNKGYASRKKLSGMQSPLANRYYGWIKSLRESTDVEKIPKDICSLRKMFLESEDGIEFRYLDG